MVGRSRSDAGSWSRRSRRLGTLVVWAAALVVAGASRAEAQAPRGCQPLVLSPSTAHFGVAGGMGSFTFPGGGVNCQWTITPGDPWVTITSPNPLNGAGGGTVTVFGGNGGCHYFGRCPRRENMVFGDRNSGHHKAGTGA